MVDMSKMQEHDANKLDYGNDESPLNFKGGAAFRFWKTSSAGMPMRATWMC
jgi:hypothetical protein